MYARIAFGLFAVTMLVPCALIDAIWILVATRRCWLRDWELGGSQPIACTLTAKSLQDRLAWIAQLARDA